MTSHIPLLKLIDLQYNFIGADESDVFLLIKICVYVYLNWGLININKKCQVNNGRVNNSKIFQP